MKCCEQCVESIPATVHVIYGMFEAYRDSRPYMHLSYLKLVRQ